ncbi:hypothetical protein HAZT_HAZT007302 [Hyalella azteca]|uniref:adenylate cyclase n=1 Tax=Hyalella azteca TaxID=294128 RepID=A0A6A0GQS5_HYAAZ|nr:hypothetical protein HAZT_HAZT007302 [Hyalella azteca]
MVPNSSDLLNPSDNNVAHNDASTEPKPGSNEYDQSLVDLSLTPHLHALLLASMTQRQHSRSCCPHLFERAARSWWNPRFDSDILEDEYVRSSRSTLRLRLRYCLGYTVLACVVWIIYWLVTGAPHQGYSISAALLVALLMIIFFAITFSKLYKRRPVLLSLLVSAVLLGSSLLPYALHDPSLEACTGLSSPAVMATSIQFFQDGFRSGQKASLCSLTLDVSATPAKDLAPSATPAKDLAPSATPAKDLDLSATPANGSNLSATPASGLNLSATPATDLAPSATAINTSPANSQNLSTVPVIINNSSPDCVDVSVASQSSDCVDVSVASQSSDCNGTLTTKLPLTALLSLPCQSSGRKPRADSLSVPQSAPACVVADPWSVDHSKELRKDSGIRSRGSSFQLSDTEGLDTLAGDYSPMASMDPSLTRYHQMRKQSDLRLIRCVQQEKRTKRTTFTYDYDMEPPFSKISLRFLDASMEKMYREQAHQPRSDEAKTLASSLYNTYFDILVSLVVHVILVVSLLVLYPPSVLWLVLLGVVLLWQGALLALSQVQLMKRSDPTKQQPQSPDRIKSRPSHPELGGTDSPYPPSLSHTIYTRVTRWKTWHFCGGVLLLLPLAAVLSNFSCSSLSEETETLRYFCYLSFVGTVHFCNFVQLNCWMKNILVTVGGGVLIALLAPPICPCPFSAKVEVVTGFNNFSLDSDFRKNTEILSNWQPGREPISINVSDSLTANLSALNSPNFLCGEREHYFHVEIIVTVALLVGLVWLLNREFEISYRLSFHGWAQALLDRSRVQAMKDQAEWMLHNIIPKHVANKIKPTNAKYSENHTRVAVMFASIVNFNEFYDESFCGGKECLRYLNELVGDFDELLSREDFENVVKIKTIGSTYMAASGLNPDVRNKNSDPDHHIFELVEFAKELQKGIDHFNKDLLGFNFVLRIGINFGDITAGVIGTTKLYYDIWGDAVNIASRMDSTGVKGRIQVSEECAKVLSRKYKLESRGQVFVKGKDNMSVYLLEDTPPHGCN